MTTLVQLVIALVILGAILYILSLLPIDGTVKRIINVIVVVVLVVWLLMWFVGGGPLLPAMRFR